MSHPATPTRERLGREPGPPSSPCSPGVPISNCEGQHERPSPHHVLPRDRDYRIDRATRTRSRRKSDRAHRLTVLLRPLAMLGSTTAAWAGCSCVLGAGARGHDRALRAPDCRGGEVLRILATIPEGGTSIVHLQFMQDGEWNTDSITRAANDSGALVLDVRLPEGRLARWIARLRVGGRPREHGAYDPGLRASAGWQATEEACPTVVTVPRMSGLVLTMPTWRGAHRATRAARAVRFPREFDTQADQLPLGRHRS